MNLVRVSRFVPISIDAWTSFNLTDAMDILCVYVISKFKTKK